MVAGIDGTLVDVELLFKRPINIEKIFIYKFGYLCNNRKPYNYLY